jgi:hypothetical protein
VKVSPIGWAKMPLTVKVRYKEMMWILLLPILFTLSSATGPKCDKSPENYGSYREPGDAGFQISMSGNPRLYRSGQTYDISLFGVTTEEGDMQPVRKNFINFMIVAESDRLSTDSPQLGTFQLKPTDAMTKFSHRCSHAVEATSAINKEEVSVLWTAPEPGSGCISLKAMVVERPDVWYMDEGSLEYVICEDESPRASVPTILPCYACDEAKYEVIFEGLWSRHTHPKDFPRDEWQTQFSHLIGASHDINYGMWKYGEEATPSLIALAEQGRTRNLEIEMKRYSAHIRSVVKARGLHQRSNIVGRTFAVFRMDKRNHLLSLATKIIPSPDWIVGISMENLCMANGSWVDSRVIDLFPWDAGSRSGVTYQDIGVETMPREAIHRITSCNPPDERSPFFDPSCAHLKPVARIHILKQREYKKQCEGQPQLPLNPSWGNPMAPASDLNNFNEVYSGRGIGPNSPESSGDSDYDDDYGVNLGDNPPPSSVYPSGNQNNCQVDEWTEWSECSSTCGMGSHHRTRSYTHPVGAQRANCKERVFEKKKCQSLQPCQTQRYIEEFEAFHNGDDLDAYSSPWSRGIATGNLQRPVSQPEVYSGNSYTYGGSVGDSYSSSPQVGNPSEYGDPSSNQYSNNYLAGYEKQEGYPPRSNPPGSSRYNPYRSSGYYGYTYGGYSPSYGQSSSSSIYQGDEVPSCEVTDWGDWSECSATCGPGTKTRNRGYVDRDSNLSCSEDLTESTTCENNCGNSVQPTFSPQVMRQPRPDRRGQRQRRVFHNNDPQCGVADWSDWSPCSVSCGNGYKIRTRLYLIPFVPDRTCEGLRLHQRVECQMHDCLYSSLYDDYESPDSYDDLQDIGQDDLEDTYDFHELEEDEDVLDDGSVVTIYEIQQPKQNFCLDEPRPGRCRGKTSRWYYNATEGNCRQFYYSSCAGNRNNFPSEQQCMDDCHPDERSPINQLQALAQTREEFLNPQPVDCQVSEWGDWSDCSATCGKGWVTRTRTILIEASNGGRRCPRKLTKRKKCRMMPCDTLPPRRWYQGNWRMFQQQRAQDIMA